MPDRALVRIDTPLLVLGPGPATLVAAKVAGACGQPCLLVGHEIVGDDVPVELDPAAVAVLERHGLLDVFRPHLLAADPLTVAPREFEEVLKRHCIADLNVGVYDRMTLAGRAVTGRSLHGVLTDGRSSWELAADTKIDADALAVALPAAVTDGEAAALEAIAALRSHDRGVGPRVRT
jgi:hypothetical protein